MPVAGPRGGRGGEAIVGDPVTTGDAHAVGALGETGQRGIDLVERRLRLAEHLLVVGLHGLQGSAAARARRRTDWVRACPHFPVT